MPGHFKLGNFLFRSGQAAQRFLVAASLAGLVVAAANAAPGVRPPVSMLSVNIHFDIPAQPLAEALQAYGDATQLSVLAPSGLLRSRMSTPVHGDHTAQQAIELLLTGTGLQARFPGGDAVTVQAPDLRAQHAPASGAGQAVDEVDGVGNRLHASYVAQIQRRVIGALCERPATRPGTYRMALRFHVASSGAVDGLRHAGGSGSAARDAAILASVGRLRLDPPPPDLPQPITLLVRPDQPGVRNACAQPGG